MQLIKAGFEILTPGDRGLDYLEIMRFIERVARTCYKSEDRIGPGTAERMVRNLLNHDPPHEAMLEFFDIVVLITTDRGVSHEIVRHRLASYAQESTRYCNYGKKGVTYIIPPWVDIAVGEYTCDCRLPAGTSEADLTWFNDLERAAANYEKLLKLGWTPQQARSVLPQSTKTDIVCKYNIREWRHVFKMRIFENAHPQMREVMRPLLDAFQSQLPIFFADLSYREPDPEAIPTKLTCPSLRKAGRSEPVFVLRAQDEIAGDAVRDWVERASMRGVAQGKIDHALLVASAMDEWPKHKLPD